MTAAPVIQLGTVPGARLIAGGRFVVAYVERGPRSVVVLADSEDDHQRIRLEFPLEVVLEATR